MTELLVYDHSRLRSTQSYHLPDSFSSTIFNIIIVGHHTLAVHVILGLSWSLESVEIWLREAGHQRVCITAEVNVIY